MTPPPGTPAAPNAQPAREPSKPVEPAGLEPTGRPTGARHIGRSGHGRPRARVKGDGDDHRIASTDDGEETELHHSDGDGPAHHLVATLALERGDEDGG